MAASIPDSKWWSDADLAFEHAKRLLSKDAFAEEPLDDNADEVDKAFREQRARSRPAISMIPISTYAMRITARDEELRCVAIGTMSKLWGTSKVIDLKRYYVRVITNYV